MSDTSLSHEQQSAQHALKNHVRCAVLTVSDSRTAQTDEGGPLIERLLTEAGHLAIARAIVRDEPRAIAAAIEQWIADQGIHAILITGGTGISRRDSTIEVVRRYLTAELEGFGELFRTLSYEQIKGAAMLSRAVGGLAARQTSDGGDTFIFAMPGSPNAVETAMKNLIAPQLAHLVWERRRV